MKYLEKAEFRDLKYVKCIKLDGNQLSVIIDNLFENQRNLEFLGNKNNENCKPRGPYEKKTIQTRMKGKLERKKANWPPPARQNPKRMGRDKNA